MDGTKQATLFVRDPGDEPPEGACLNWSDCRNYPPGHPETDNQICDSCLDEIRHRDTDAEYSNYPDHLRSVAGSE